MKSYKMYIPDTPDHPREHVSTAVQKHAFSLGFMWRHELDSFYKTDEPFLYFNDKLITYNSMEFFDDFFNHKNIEITPDEFLKLVSEPVYRPFTLHEIADLLGYQVFMSGVNGTCLILSVHAHDNYKFVVLIGDNYMTTEDMLQKCMFVDGSICGVKEEEDGTVR